MISPTVIEPGLEGEDWGGLSALIQGEIQAYGGQAYDASPTIVALGRPGSLAVKRAFLGDGSNKDRVIHLEYSRSDTFVSTDRAAMPPARRPAVADTYTFLCRRGSAAQSWTLKSAKSTLRLVPEAVGIASMAQIEGTGAYQQALRNFGSHPYATRLSDRPLAPKAPTRGLLRRLLRPPVQPDPPLPPRQVKWILERWLPRGTHRFGDIFERAQGEADATITSDGSALAWTIEFWEMPGPRYVHWHFHGTLLRVIQNPTTSSILATECFRTG